MDGEPAKSFQRTPRRTEIVRLLAQGFTRDEIASQLFLSPNTIRSHMRAMSEQLGARNTTHLVSIWWEHGWLRPPEQREPRQVRLDYQTLEYGNPEPLVGMNDWDVAVVPWNPTDRD